MHLLWIYSRVTNLYHPILLRDKLLKEYHPPDFASKLKNPPSHRIQLGNFPTPIQPWKFTWREQTYNMLIKRDDLSDLTASGNKIRKLEFILPQAILGGNDWILSLGPVQSNSCRVLSAIAPRLGLRSAHVLIKTVQYREEHPLEGNLFFHKLFDSQLFLKTREEYLERGQDELLEEARTKLSQDFGASNPYIVPMGGSTSSGVFGYIEFFQELTTQLEAGQVKVDKIFFACGSGGTAAGLGIGKYLASSPYLKDVQLIGCIVWDSTPQHFHDQRNAGSCRIGG